MMQRLYLVLGPGGDREFDADRLRTCLQTLSGISNWREDTETERFACEIKRQNAEDVRVPVEVASNLCSISIGAYCDEGLAAALQLQHRYEKEMLAFSEESLPEMVKLSDIETTAQLAERLKLR